MSVNGGPTWSTQIKSPFWRQTTACQWQPKFSGAKHSASSRFGIYLDGSDDSVLALQVAMDPGPSKDSFPCFTFLFLFFIHVPVPDSKHLAQESESPGYKFRHLPIRNFL